MSDDRKNRPPVPGPFAERIRRQFPDEAGPFLQALEQDAHTAIRLHPHKQPDTPLFPDLISGPVPWSVHGRFLSERPSFTLDPLYHAGCYYVQEASSMFLERVLTHHELQQAGDLMLDACAAPGGKATLMAAMFPDALIVANEVIRSRVTVLKEQVMKWGTGNMAVTGSPTNRFSGAASMFDLILTDVPCSGEGLFRKDPASRSQWNSDTPRHCALRQQSIVDDVWLALRPGGYLIYTTCTFDPGENEQNIARLLEQTGATCLSLPDEIVEPDQTGIRVVRDGDVTGYAFYPHQTGGEGFFLSVIRKPEIGQNVETRHGVKTGHGKETGQNSRTGNPGKSRSPISEPDPAHIDLVHDWFSDASDASWFESGGHLYRIRSRYRDKLHLLSSIMPVLYAGTQIGKPVRNGIRPAPAAALDMHLKTSVFPKIDCNLEEAIKYLRREPLSVPDGVDRGWLLAVYNGRPLGWLKNTGTRLNNYHPNEWRIRMANPPPAG